ncbi:MAG: hypothetical protein JWO11_2895, partial [Nocardioides sp.]|nr:hypothetical protein [Nocardioides sp.]
MSAGSRRIVERSAACGLPAVNDDRTPIEITSRRGHAVLLSRADYDFAPAAACADRGDGQPVDPRVGLVAGSSVPMREGGPVATPSSGSGI